MTRVVCWGDVAPGDVVRVATGLLWNVSAVADGRVDMWRDGGVPVSGRPDPAGPVVLVSRSADDGAEGEALLALSLVSGGLLGVQDSPRAPWRVPKTIPDLSTFRSHGFMLHGIHMGDLKDRGAVERVHRQSHEDDLAGVLQPGFQAHVHDDSTFGRG